MRELVWHEPHLVFRNDWHLPIPEDNRIRARPDYRNAVRQWRRARAVVLIGYAFGGGADALSYEDFGRNVPLGARVHALCPHPDNRDLRKQVGAAFTRRGPRLQVLGHPFRWRSFAEAVLELLRQVGGDRVRLVLGRERELAALHDRM